MVHETRPEHGRRGSARTRARLVFTLIGVGALVVGVFLDWTTGSLTGSDLTPRSLVRNDFGTADDVLRSIGAVSVLIGLVALLGLLDRTGWLTRLAGLAAVALFAMFAVEVFRHNGERFGPAYDALRPGAWCQLGGGVLLLVGGMIRYRRKHARKRDRMDSLGRTGGAVGSADVESERLAADTVVQRPVPSEVGAATDARVSEG